MFKLLAVCLLALLACAAAKPQWLTYSAQVGAVAATPVVATTSYVDPYVAYPYAASYAAWPYSGWPYAAAYWRRR